MPRRVDLDLGAKEDPIPDVHWGAVQYAAVKIHKDLLSQSDVVPLRPDQKHPCQLRAQWDVHMPHETFSYVCEDVHVTDRDNLLC